MKKINKIDCCLNCPLRKVNIDRRGSYCTHQAVEGMELFSLVIIDKNCPLPEDD